MRAVARRWALVAVGLLLVSACEAHEVRPAYLEITQSDATTYQILWKQPTLGNLTVHIVPHLSNAWLERRPDSQYVASTFEIKKWTVHVSRDDPGPAGSRVTIGGLGFSAVDVFVQMHLLDGRNVNAVIYPEAPQYIIPKHPHFGVPAYLVFGIEHILTGPDHLLFVLGLVLLVGNRPKRLLTTVSAFTIAHSLTLAAVALGKVSLPPPFVESLISLSILLLAPEVLRARAGESTLTGRYPWALAFFFGLFHGMGFASGLKALGFSRENLIPALLSFNFGVEIGQLTFITLVLATARLLRATPVRHWSAAPLVPVYAVGVLGAYWTIDRAAVWLIGAG
jgi:hydrogenase/urease accessory protein HupE